MHKTLHVRSLVSTHIYVSEKNWNIIIFFDEDINKKNDKRKWPEKERNKTWGGIGANWNMGGSSFFF